MAHDEQVQAKLNAELVNLRAYLASHPGATPMRVGKAALKEIHVTPGSRQTPEAVASGVPRSAWEARAEHSLVTPR